MRRGPTGGGMAVAILVIVAGSRPALAQPNELPPPLAAVGFEQRLGERLPLDARFRDESGKEVAVADLLRGRPVILVPGYYECPMLCSLVLNGLTTSLKVLAFDAGREFDVVAISIDASEGPELAAAKKRSYVGRYGRAGSADGWRFLTGREPEIRRLTDAIGFRYRYDPASGEYAHAAGIIVLTPDGRIARVFYGVEFPARDLRLGLVEAAGGTIGSAVDEILLYCFRYDPSTGKYSAAVLNLVRAGGVLTVLLLAIAVTTMVRRERQPPQGAAR